MLDLNNLNEVQVKPVTDTEGQLLVVAGAGSGKTRVLTYRIAYLIQNCQVDPYNILAITFTNKAAGEMKSRIDTMTGLDDDGGGAFGWFDNSRVWVSTFHSMCNRILRLDIDKIGYSKNFSIYAENETERVLKRIITAKCEADTKKVGKVRWHISQAKNLGLSPDAYAARTYFSSDEDFVIDVFKEYEAELKKSNALDFDDLLLKTVELFAHHPEVLQKYSKRFHYIHIDEFQDTNKIQYLLLRMLAEHHKNVFAVGDDDQSIYGWRGADVSNMLNFRKDFPDVKVYKLEQNYRSTQNILNAANSVIAFNKNRITKKLWTKGTGGEKVVVKENYSDRDEAVYFISNVGEFLSSGKYKLSDIALLVRQNSLTRLFEEKLNLYGYPYRVFGGFRFYERKEIKDIIAYMRVVSNPSDGEALLRIINFPKRGIGQAVLDKLGHYMALTGKDYIDTILEIENIDYFGGAAKVKLVGFKNMLLRLIDASNTLPLSEYVAELIKISGLETYYTSQEGEEADRFENVLEFANAVGEFVKDNPLATAEQFLQSVSLVSELDAEDTGEKLTVATIHSVKGLEFPVVFIAGVEENLFPSMRSLNEDSECQEERRVMYVAMTRAKQKLFVTYAKTRFRFNEVVYSSPSRFIKEMISQGLDGIDYLVSEKSSYGGTFGVGFNNTGYVSGGGRDNSSGNTFHSKGGGRINSDGYGYRDKNSPYLAPERQMIEKMLSRPAYPGAAAGAARQNSAVDIQKFKKDVRVLHKKFGQGVIVSITGEGSDATAHINFEGLGVKRFVLGLAPLTLVE